MLLGATILCSLVLLALIADRLGTYVWNSGENRFFYRCDSCDLRYPRGEMEDPELRICPQGHPVIVDRPRLTAGLLGMFVCLGFLCAALLLILTGAVH